jgi:hypothetical protein
MTTISATSILASKHAVTGDRLDTLLLRYPLVIHAELMTHRVFSRNAASARAIPVAKLIADVERDPFIPLVWTMNERGMQGREVLTGNALTSAKLFWHDAKREALTFAERLAETGAHKQIVNRLLHPFAHITVVVSSTDWTGFLAQRDHADAEPHMQMLAREIRAALDDAQLQVLSPGEWHMPFIDPKEFNPDDMESMKRLSVARCASTSYKTVDDFDMSLERAQEIYDKLRSADPIHASPFEHVAQADEIWAFGADCEPRYSNPHQHRNFRGFRQLRAMIEDER